ncbi:MAG: sulfotransferase [Phycisphaerales bacterium]|nr:sulfotransferase [Phycisphaerales bacterium]
MHALKFRPDDEEIEICLARVYSSLGKSQQSLEWCDRVLVKSPSSTAAREIKANVLERKGDWQGGLAALESINENTKSPQLNWLTARCLLQSDDREAALKTIDEGLSLPNMEHPNNAAIRARLLLQRAKIFDGMDQYDSAFLDAQTAKKLIDVPFDQDLYVSEIDQLIETFSAEQLQRKDGHIGSECSHVFIAGMPRSGTTLVEQILDSHPDATGVGEAKEIDILARSLQKLIGSWSPWPKCARDIGPEDGKKMLASYEDSLARHGYALPSTFINKNLKNVRLLGLIAMLFPHSKIVFTRRDPRDVGISCLMGNFSPRVHPELMDLDRIAMAIEQNDRLIEHWKTVLPMPWIEINYEDVVADKNRMTRDVVEFCGLPWDDRCLEFYDSGRTVMTLSYDQVNKPIYNTSVGRYRNYESHIDPLMALAKQSNGNT